MVVIKQMPDAERIKGLAGSIDFYESSGQVIARRWPRKAAPRPGTGSWVTAELFGMRTRANNDLSPMAREVVSGQWSSPETAVNDGAISTYYGHLQKNYYQLPDGTEHPINPGPEPPPVSKMTPEERADYLWFASDIDIQYSDLLRFATVNFKAGINDNFHVIASKRPPTFHRRYKRVRGVNRPCGYEIAWWYQIEGVTNVVPAIGHSGRPWFGMRGWSTNQPNGRGLWFVQPVKILVGAPYRVISLGPIVATYSRMETILGLNYLYTYVLGMNAYNVHKLESITDANVEDYAIGYGGR